MPSKDIVDQETWMHLVVRNAAADLIDRFAFRDFYGHPR